MKKLFFIALLFLAISTNAQITVSSNPALVAPATTTTQAVTISKTFISDPNGTLYGPIVFVLIKFPSSNSGTVQVNTLSSSVTGSPAYAAGTQVAVAVKDIVWIKLSNSADKYEISWF